MPEPSILKISEIFWSVQGEGRRLGEPAVFIRLCGCQLRCPFCDTVSAFSGGRTADVAAILQEVRVFTAQYPQSSVIITGGEPLEQDLAPLAAALKSERLFVAVETNGLHAQAIAADWWSVSPKCASGYFIHPELAQRISEIKLVVTPELDVPVVSRIRADYPHIPLFLQPEYNDHDKYRRTFALYRACLEQGLNGVYPGLQFHKVYGID